MTTIERVLEAAVNVRAISTSMYVLVQSEIFTMSCRVHGAAGAQADECRGDLCYYSR